MNSNWNTLPLGEVIDHRKEFITIDDLQVYKRCRVQTWAQGIVLRDEIQGFEIKTKRQQVCRSGEFLVAEIDAKVGGFGIVPDELDGAIVSSHYFLYIIDESQLNSHFLEYFIRTPAFLDQVTAQGSTNYAAIRPHHVLEYKIPLPPLDEQRRIVAHIEEVATRIEAVHGLRQGTAEETEALLGAMQRNLIGSEPQSNWIPLSTFVATLENGWSPSCEKRQANTDEWGVLKVGAVSFGHFNPSENKALPFDLAPRPEYEVQPGDFLMSRANTASLVGACAFVRETRPRLMLSDKIFRFILRDNAEVELRYLDYILKSPALRGQIEKVATGTSPTMKNISKGKTLALSIPPHDLFAQREIIAELDELQAYVDDLRHLQIECATELDALLPSVLDRAFRGEL